MIINLSVKNNIPLRNILIHIMRIYPNPSDLCNYRITKMVYLLDWYCAMNFNRQATNINWFFDNYGPFVWDIKDTIEGNPDIFNIKYTQNMYGGEKYLFSLRNMHVDDNLCPEIREALNYVVDATAKLDFASFTRLVYSTYPIVTTPQYHELNLLEKAKELRERDKQIHTN